MVDREVVNEDLIRLTEMYRDLLQYFGTSSQKSFDVSSPKQSQTTALQLESEC